MFTLHLWSLPNTEFLFPKVFVGKNMFISYIICPNSLYFCGQSVCSVCYCACIDSDIFLSRLHKEKRKVRRWVRKVRNGDETASWYHSAIYSNLRKKEHHTKIWNTLPSNQTLFLQFRFINFIWCKNFSK